MANTTYEQVPLDGPTSPKLPQAAAEPETPITPVTPNFEKKSLLSKLSYGFPTRSPDSPETPKTPATLSFERKGLLKRLTGGYQPTKEELEADPLERLQRQDTHLKKRIRTLKVYSRLIAACLSIAVLVPLAITLHKYLNTREQYRTVSNASLGGQPVRRTAWAVESNTWPTYMYFSIAVISLTFNTAVMISYLHSIKTANKVATWGGVFTGAVLLLNLVVWTVTTALYKQQSVVVNDRGVQNDLWGWTCSPAARALQPVFHDQINFDTYCDIQSVSFYIGLVQVGASLLTIILMGLALRRLQSKKAVRKSMTMQGS